MQLVDHEPVLAGVTGSEVSGVTAELGDGGTTEYLPVPIGESDTRGFSFTRPLDGITNLTWLDITGARLGTVEPG